MNDDDDNLDNLLNKFKLTYNAFHIKNMLKYLEIENNTSQLKLFKKKFPYIKNKHSFCEIYKLFEYPEFIEFKLIKEYIFENCSRKIRGFFKHGQSAKTEISCIKIMKDIMNNIITFCITKNTLLANKQFTSRLIKLLKAAGFTNLKEFIIVISSQFNDLDGNATHCKDLYDAWSKICNNKNNYMVVFVCANSTRINDICNLLSNYTQPTFNQVYIKKVVIQYDEAHNFMSGIPVCRGACENMLLYDFVLAFIPITASNKTIFDEYNPIWFKDNINKNKLNYINKDLAKSCIKSDDESYSSIIDACFIDTELLNKKVYDNTIKRELFNKHYPNESYERKGRVNSCPILLCGDEELALNCAKEILDNPEYEYENYDNDDIEVCTEKIFQKCISNFHIMIVPRRTVITEMIMEYAAIRDYYPITIGLYGGKIHYRYKNLVNGKLYINKPCGIQFDDSKEFNEILNDFLIKKGLKNRPVIIIGNYQTVGESNTFVNSDYGYIRSVSVLSGCILTPEQHYQFILRLCFLFERFNGLKKLDVTKFIIGNKKSYDDAIEYEKLNDNIIQELIDNPEQSEISFDYRNSSSSSGLASSVNSQLITTNRYSVPVKFTIEDIDCEYVVEIRKIMKIDNRTLENKKLFMEYLIKALIESSVIKYDNNVEKIILENYILTEFRCYKDGLDPVNYRFNGYYDRWVMSEPYKNGELNTGECSICCCLKKHTSDNGHITNQNTFYLLFAN